jgi:glutaconate CoA-transferase subunit A
MTDAESLIASLPRGATVAIGGLGLNRKPMGLVRALVEAGARDLVLVSFLGSVDVELLVAAGCVAEIHTSGTSLDGMGLAPRYRAARQAGTPRVVEWSEGSLAAALEAAARGFDSMPAPTSPRSDLVATNPYLKTVEDPFSGAAVVQAKALRPDLGLVEGSAVDAAGNVHIDGDPGVDGLVARASRRTIASVPTVEERDPAHAAIGRIWLETTVVDPMGPWPTLSGSHALADLRAVGAWVKSAGEDPAVLMEVPS